MPLPSHPPWFNRPNSTWWSVQVVKLVFMQLFAASSPRPPSTFPLSILFPNTLNLCSSLSVRDQVSHSYKTTYKIIVLCILMFKFLERRTEWLEAFSGRDQLFNFFMNVIWFDWVLFYPKCLNFATVSNDLLASFILCILSTRHNYILSSLCIYF
jgi:hypothetical protein